MQVNFALRRRQRPEDRPTVARLECAVGAWTFEALADDRNKRPA